MKSSLETMTYLSLKKAKLLYNYTIDCKNQQSRRNLLKMHKNAYEIGRLKALRRWQNYLFLVTIWRRYAKV